VQEYNTGIQQFPAVLLAGSLGFTPKEYFDVGVEKRKGARAGAAGEVLMNCDFVYEFQENRTDLMIIALLFPILLWIAARCQPLFTAAAVFIVTLGTWRRRFHKT
jgi:hypothetical protein